MYLHDSDFNPVGGHTAPAWADIDPGGAPIMDDKVFWIQLTLWMMLPAEYVFRVWHPKVDRSNPASAFALIVAVGILLSIYSLYSFYNSSLYSFHNPVPQQPTRMADQPGTDSNQEQQEPLPSHGRYDAVEVN
jgi:hypothetical protein